MCAAYNLAVLAAVVFTLDFNRNDSFVLGDGDVGEANWLML